MADQLTSLIELFVTHAMFYPICGAFIILDCLCPIFPGESLLSMAGAWAGATGRPSLRGVIAVGMIAAIIGDNICYALGTRFVHIIRNANPRSKLARAARWVNHSMRRRAGLSIIIARFIPWARWVLTIMLGATRYSWWRFFLFDTIGVTVWALQASLIGYLGGWVVQDYPLVGMALGIIMGFAVGILIDRLRARFSDYHEVITATSAA
ncbi:DedA family protein [Corynebacterium uberis]|uniref:DedA family protein n=1 Tax=Corynebacterium TaxID=1716 RepID=UPI001D0AAB37|nr:MULTISPECIES: DedA family protein [Corynebacterium]MCZ9309963.1 DedA family protein [Corynebacterium sp. c6VSa_13]UDL73118.1 DedA family protein [Corynebacterium uberis]UDL76005.1 DedA family protein [Corynebacterium uberis]UDL78217.1 DedA family protein [Corynebacterium uberis]UDL80500.1 DedA family protein [Corynebacterium uberis]